MLIRGQRYMLTNLFTDNLKYVGDFYFDHTFVEYSGEPILFACRNQQNELYLCRAKTGARAFRWIFSKVNVDDLKRLVDKSITVRECLINGNNIFTLVGHANYYGEINREILNGIEKNDLPDATLYLSTDDSAARYVKALNSDIASCIYSNGHDAHKAAVMNDFARMIALHGVLPNKPRWHKAIH